MIKIAIIAFQLLLIIGLLIGKNNYQAELSVRKHINDSLVHYSDSLYYELIPLETMFNRYEIAYFIFSQRNPKAASQYGDIISNETE
jgi:hypothetical protein